MNLMIELSYSVGLEKTGTQLRVLRKNITIT